MHSHTNKGKLMVFYGVVRPPQPVITKPFSVLLIFQRVCNSVVHGGDPERGKGEWASYVLLILAQDENE